MPNKTGGKNYKKTKHSSSEKPLFIEASEDQQYARVIQVLGNRNVLTFCNDNIVRLCHIRGSIRKDTWINNGDIVLISLRGFVKDKDDSYERGDILYRYDREYHTKLSKEESINSKLFLNLERSDVNVLKRIGSTKFEFNEDFDIKNPNSNDDVVFENPEEEDFDIGAI